MTQEGGALLRANTVVSRSAAQEGEGAVAADWGLCYAALMRRLPMLVVLAALGWTTLAHAYVLPASYLLRLLAEKRRSLSLKDLSLQLSAELAGVDAPVDERIYLKTPERLRYLWQEDDATQLYVEREGQRASGREDSLHRLAGPPTDLLAVLLAPTGRDVDDMTHRLWTTLKAAGVDTSVVSLGRQGDTVAYIIGARSWEPNKPQVWLNKSNFMPMRAVVYGRDKSRYETRWLEYGSSIVGDYFPAVIESYKDGKRVRRAEVTKMAVNQSLPETLFELPRG